MTKLEDTTGGLVIVLDDTSVRTQPNLPPGKDTSVVCNKMAKAPVCVVRGKTAIYEVYQFQMAPNSCDFLPLPAFVTAVSNTFCKGLAGSEGLLPQPNSHPASPVVAQCTSK